MERIGCRARRPQNQIYKEDVRLEDEDRGDFNNQEPDAGAQQNAKRPEVDRGSQPRHQDDP